MFAQDLSRRSLKGTSSTKPFVDNDPQRILIAGYCRMFSYLLWSHIRHSTDQVFGLLRASAMSDDSNTKVAQQDFVTSPYQHVCWLDVAMNELLIMSILQGISNLFDIGNNSRQGNLSPCRVTIFQCATQRIVHDHKRRIVLHAKIQQT